MVTIFGNKAALRVHVHGGGVRGKAHKVRPHQVGGLVIRVMRHFDRGQREMGLAGGAQFDGAEIIHDIVRIMARAAIQFWATRLHHAIQPQRHRSEQQEK